MITLTNINKSYPSGNSTLHVLKDINLTVDEGEYVSILGASGSGKSTLMNIIGCMDNIDSGTYELAGKHVELCNDDELAIIRNEKIGFIFQRYHLIQQYDILQNVMMPLLIRKVPRAQAIERSLECIKLVGLDERCDHRPNQLSGGQQQRVAIARALVTKPAILLADEPTGALDSKTGQEILKLFHDLNDAGHTIIQITHDINVAKAGKRIISLQDGVIVDDN